MKKMVLAVAVLAIGFASCNKKADANESTNDTLNQVDTTQVVDDHTSQTAVDWAGIYVGALPCADCEGIQTEIALNDDDTFVVKQTYLGKEGAPVEENGKIMWHDGTIAHLKGNTIDMKLKVGENQVFVLDQDGKEIEGAMKDLYILKKN
nr:copper resistance protein NlpE [uncultured Flavobacterium sp.]